MSVNKSRNSSMQQNLGESNEFNSSQIKETRGESDTEYSANFNHGVDEDDFNMDFKNEYKGEATASVDSQSYDYMNTEEQNFEDRNYQEKAVLFALILCIGFNVAVSVIIFVIKYKCESLENDNCKSGIDAIGFKTLE